MHCCPACGHENPDDIDRCQNCAAVLAQRCTACGHLVPVGSKFCNQCGAPLSENAALPADPLWQANTLQGLRAMMPASLAEQINATSIQAPSERREVTVIFLDVTNFTLAAHHMDSEDAFLLIDEAMRLLVQVIYTYEGTVDKFTGDGLMALFGAPLAHENDPERAVRAALEMQTVLQPVQARVKQNHGVDFQVRIGINTGLVVAGKLGSDLHMEYTVIGDTVNMAARLETAAPPGIILVSQATYARTRPLFRYEVLAPLTVKGISQPVQAYRPLGLLEKPGQSRGLPGLHVPMVGRHDALARLQNALVEARQQQQPRLALITGEAGLGKSRLVREFRVSLAPPGVSVYEGSCLAYARSTPLWLVGSLLRNILQLQEANPAPIQRARLQTYLSQRSIDHDVPPYLLHLLGLGQTDLEAEARLRLLDESMLQRQTHTALRQVILAEAHLAPTVLILEDLHWVDPASRDFVEYLIQAIDDVPLVLVLISREGDTAAQALLASIRQNSVRLVDIQLQPLSEAEVQLLVKQLLPQTTEQAQALKARIAERAEGNPFYAEEIIRMLIDQGGLTGQDGGWQVTPRAHELVRQVPGTLQGLILARFDRLPDTLRRTLQEAAVLGRSFPLSLFRKVSGATPEAVAENLVELEQRQFLASSPFESEQGYTFHHALIQEAVYETLLKRDRREIHERTARAIESAAFWPPDEQAEVLAFHYAESPHPLKAVPYLVTAAENAARRFAHEIVIQHYRRALSLMQDQPAGESGQARMDLDQSLKSARIRIRLGQALKFVGEFSQANQVLAEALQLLRNSGAKPNFLVSLLAEGLRELADVRLREGALDEAMNHLEEAFQTLKQADEQQDSVLSRSLLDRMAWVRFRQGNLQEAFELAQWAAMVTDLEPAEDPATLASLFNTLGGVLWQQGNQSEAIAHVERSLELYKSLGYSWGMAIAYTNLGVLYYARGKWPQAVESFERAYILQRENGCLPGQAVPLKNLGLLHLAMGNHTQAQKDLGASLEISRRLGDDFGTVCAQIGITLLAVTQGNFYDATRYLEAAMGLLAAAGEDEAIQAHWLLALIQAENGDLQTGLQSAEKALQMAKEAKILEQETECLRVLGALRARSGEYMQAEALFRESISLSSQRNDAYQKGLALLALGEMCQHLAHPDNPTHSEWQNKARQVLGEATQLFESLGAAHDLQVAQEALRQVQADSSIRGHHDS